MHLPGLIPGPGHLASTGITIRISADTDNYNVFTNAGSPTDSVRVTVFVESGVFIGSTSVGAASIDFDGFPAGSKLKLVNDGDIRAKGGNGGNANSGSGQTGGTAVKADLPITIDNNNGNIFGGGNGGSGGSGGSHIDCTWGGGGGGGGQGDTGGSGGSGASSSGGTSRSNGKNGSGGGPSGGGGGGNGGNCSHSPSEFPETHNGGPGSSGGSWGGGFSVDADGQTITWLGGNNATQVKGAEA